MASQEANSGSLGITSDELKSLIEESEKYAPEAHVATYIPELRMAIEGKMGICVTSIAGTVTEAGDTYGFRRDPERGFVLNPELDNGFTIQSISKVFALLYALETRGEDHVFRWIGREPTGDKFNAPPRFEGHFHKPANPMINAGAILVTSFFLGKDKQEKFGKYMEFVKLLCGDDGLFVDENVAASEKRTGHGNRSLAWRMLADGILGREKDGRVNPNGSGDIDESVRTTEDVLDNYFRQCSVVVCCRHLAKAASVLANGGIDPKTGLRIVESKHATSVVALMSSCGLYDGSGDFSHNVGIPGKSGVGGGIMCVVPRKAGIATFCPANDERGNSARGLYALEKLTERHHLSVYLQPPSPARLATFRTGAELDELATKTKFADAPRDAAAAHYIPELGAANASDTGVAICLTDGTVIHGGDWGVRFSTQSISNAFALLYVLTRKAEGFVFQHVGKEPSGEAFDSLRTVKVGDRDVPFNPMINAGAIVVASMIPAKYSVTGSSDSLAIDDFIEFVRVLCGNPTIDIDHDVYSSEKKAGFKNRSLAWLMNDKGAFNEILKRQEIKTLDDAVIESILDVYFRLCSLSVNCDDLARFGAVLANCGRDLQTGRQLVSPRNVTIVTAMMASTGLYNGSGEFAYRVGVPAKSGVSGGIVGVVPGRMGIATYGPVIDKKGNSFRGQVIFEALSRAEALSIFSTTSPAERTE